jgi:N-acetylglucosaminyldiphosphoundecaprenol N-acetyl-beta-D-mannosaminyltransferase
VQQFGGETAGAGTANVLGVGVSARSLEETTAQVIRWAEGGLPPSPRYVCATSVHGLIEGWRDPAFRRILNGAAVVAPDGTPLVWVGRLRGQRGMSRVSGPALMREVCRRSAGRAIRHFLYGGAPGVGEALAERLARDFPGVHVAGTYCPPFRELTAVELTDVAAVINASGAEVVWVGLSTPKQERWIGTVRGQLRTKVVVSVGAAFDFLTDRLQRAPRWMQGAGLEWLFRLAQEPRRLWRRYAYNNPLFVGLALLQLTGLKSFSDSAISVEHSDES